MFKKFNCSILLVVIFLVSCNPSPEKTTPTKQDISESVYASGIIKSKFQYEVVPSANGIIHEILVSEGDHVQAGSPLMTISDASTKLNKEMAALSKRFSEKQNNMAKLKELEINIDLAKAKMENDSLLLVRQQTLNQKEIGSDVELEQKRLAFINAKTAFQTAILNHRELERQIEFNEENAIKNLEIANALENDLIVKSEIDGLVYALLKEKGEMVNPQVPVAVIGDPDEFILELQVDEYDIVKVEKNQKIKVSLDSYQDLVFDATVTKINPMMDDRSKTFLVEAAFVNPPDKLFPNLTLEANIIINEKKNALLVPSAYIFRDQYVIKEEGDTVEVKLGIKNYLKTEILSGIDEHTSIQKP
ncbi:MAG: HlyD family efflux transporter periplasmic adaptor subunit [Cyclobacteriaceae bacterium]